MNRPTHFEIHAEDCERAIKFYGEVFGWTFEKWENKQAGAPEYYMITTGESTELGINGGLFKRMGPPPADVQAVNAYVVTMNVADIDETISKVEKTGGTLALPKFALPGMAWVAYYKDTEGNIFGIYQEDKNAK
jgi:predicted enzyme related to lactoylglutathione lyase